MKRKAVSLALTAAMVAAMAAGCGNASDGGASSASGGGSGESKDGVVELEFVNNKREAADTLQKIVDDFNTKNPDIKVTLNTLPDGSGALMTRASSDSLPDLFVHRPTESEYLQIANEELLADLKDKDYTKNIKSTYIDSMTTEDGKVYLLPISLNFMGVFYNVDKFEEAGLSVPATWDELIAVCEQIKARGETPFLFPNKDSWTVSQLWDNISSKERGAYTDFYAGLDDGSQSWSGDAIAKDSLEKMILLTEEYSQGDTLSLGYDQAINDFATGKAYMFAQGSWALPSFESANPDMNVAMFPMPNESGDMKQPVGVDNGICVSAKSAADEKKGPAIDKFLSFLISTEGGQMYADMDHSPSTIEGVTADIPQDQMVLDLIDQVGELDVAVPPVGFEDAKRAEIQNVFMGTSAEDFLALMDDEWKAAREAE